MNRDRIPDFSTLASLLITAKFRDFRLMNDNENEAEFREALAVHIDPIDPQESRHIRIKYRNKVAFKLAEFYRIHNRQKIS